MLHLTRQARHKTVLGFAKFEGWEDDHRKDVGGEGDLWSNSLSIFRLYQPVLKSTDPLTPTEQLLYSEAIQRGLKELHVGFPKELQLRWKCQG